VKRRRPPRGKDGNTGAKRARQAREAVGLDGVSPVPCLVEVVETDFGLPVTLSAMADGYEGACTTFDGRTALWVNHVYAPRTRFTLAHELGHVRCEHGAFIVDTAEDMRLERTSAEKQANAFAAEFLAPADAVEEMLDGDEATLEEVVAIAVHFGVSALSAYFRCSTLGRVDAAGELERRVREGEQKDVPAPDGVAPPDDVCGGLEREDLPRVSPRLGPTGIGALIDGTTSVEDVAAASACDAADLRACLSLLGL
jgi:Zn-dependent peptidase ImmA (M78 family)